MSQRKLTLNEALSLLNDSEDIHTFRNGSMMLMGCDWNKTSLIESMTKYSDTLQLSGSTARAMQHGLVLCDNTGYLFIETDEKKLNIFDSQ